MALGNESYRSILKRNESDVKCLFTQRSMSHSCPDITYMLLFSKLLKLNSFRTIIARIEEEVIHNPSSKHSRSLSVYSPNDRAPAASIIKTTSRCYCWTIAITVLCERIWSFGRSTSIRKPFPFSHR